MSITPSYAVDNEKKSSKPIFNGNTLYVGGSGEGNYSKIQDAIDNATDGDTVFVYDDSSPYYECVYVNKSIFLIGENRETTIISTDSTNIAFTISSNVSISGFRFQNNYRGIICKNCAGVEKINVINNIFEENNLGIWAEDVRNVSILNNTIINNIYGCGGNYCYYYNVSNNLVQNNSEGIIARRSENVKIFRNTIKYNLCGIFIQNLYSFGEISNNLIDSNNHGIIISASTYKKNFIYQNLFLNNSLGLELSSSSHSKSSMNNFIENQVDIDFLNNLFDSIKTLFRVNVFDSNYYDSHDSMNSTNIKIIEGHLYWYVPVYPYDTKKIIPWYCFDWHPARKPYDIPIGG